ncbi:MAG: class I SAM-dependent methyltransferase [Pyrinomonadaceae bacterium]
MENNSLHTDLPQPSNDTEKRFHKNELLKYEGEEFVLNAYRAILRREANRIECEHQLEMLLSGRFDRIDILARLRYSPEGRRQNVLVDGLPASAWVRYIYRIPILGYLARLLILLPRLPVVIRRNRQFEMYTSTRIKRLENQLEQALKAVQTVRAESKRLREKLTSQHSAVENEEITHHLDDLYAQFEEQFRGSRDIIKGRLSIYLPLLEEAGIRNGIVDLGCGRGDWLELLKEMGLGANGVDVNHVLLAQCRDRGLVVMESDVISYLRRLPDNCLNAVTSFHLIEHLPFETLVMMVDEIQRTLRPGGLIILETPNPKNVLVGSYTFYADPTHRNPIFPETIKFILTNRGFTNVELNFLNPIEGSPFTDQDAGTQALNNWFFGPADFAVIAYKASV